MTCAASFGSNQGLTRARKGLAPSSLTTYRSHGCDLFEVLPMANYITPLCGVISRFAAHYQLPL